MEGDTEPKKFDIIAYLPAELLLQVFDWLSETEVVQLCSVSKVWNARITGVKWGNRIRYLPKNGRNDWPDRLPTVLKSTHLSRNLRYLETSAWRLKYAWKQNIQEWCPVLKTLVIHSMLEAPIDGFTMLAGSQIEVLKLIDITPEYCEAWLPNLDCCPALKVLNVSYIDTVESTADLKTRPAGRKRRRLSQAPRRTFSTPDVPQGLMQNLDTFKIEISVNSRENGHHDWWRGDHWLVAGRLSSLARTGFGNLVQQAPNLRTLKILMDGVPGWRDSFDSFLHLLSVQHCQIQTGVFDGIEVWPDDLRLYKNVTLLESSKYSFVSAREWYPLWDTNIEMLDIQRPIMDENHGFTVIPITQNLRRLKLDDALGELASALVYTLIRGLPRPVPSLKDLYLSGTAGTRDSDERWYSHKVIAKTVIFATEDVKLLVRWFPKLESIDLINLFGVDAVTAKEILTAGLPDLRHINIDKTGPPPPRYEMLLGQRPATQVKEWSFEKGCEVPAAPLRPFTAMTKAEIQEIHEVDDDDD